MIIQVDTREQQYQHVSAVFDAQGVTWFRSKLVVGDYVNFDRPHIAIDRKKNLQELAGNVCQQHERFRAELERAALLKVRLIVLVEEPGFNTLRDVNRWYNPRLKFSKGALTGQKLFKILYSLQQRYGLEVRFCTPQATGETIIGILTEENDGVQASTTI